MTGCQDCCCEMTNGLESTGCSKPSLETVGEPARTTGWSSKRCCGWRVPPHRSETYRRHSVHEIPCSDASLADQTKGSGKPSLPAYPRMRISRRSFSTALSFAPTSTRQVRRKRTTRSWLFSWGTEHQDSCCGRWLGHPEPVHPHGGGAA